MSAKRFRVAFSFAGERRNFVEKVANILANRFTKEAILYDRFHEPEFANADLAFELPTLYKTNSDLIVAVFCRNYEEKPWCGLEWRAIFSVIKEGGAKCTSAVQGTVRGSLRRVAHHVLKYGGAPPLFADSRRRMDVIRWPLLRAGAKKAERFLSTHR